jgi:hypothetical protein
MTCLETKHRAVLGNKTTNLKTNAFKTPGPFGRTSKPEKTNRRTSTVQRIKKAAPVTQQAQTKVYSEAAQDDVPDIEYMPPKPTGMDESILRPQSMEALLTAHSSLGRTR